MSEHENPLVDAVAVWLYDFKPGLGARDSESAAVELLDLVNQTALRAMGVNEHAHAWVPMCGSGEIRVTITKAGKINPESSDPERWMLLLADTEAGHIARMVSLNKPISQYLRSTLAMIEDELPE